MRPNHEVAGNDESLASANVLRIELCNNHSVLLHSFLLCSVFIHIYFLDSYIINQSKLRTSFNLFINRQDRNIVVYELTQFSTDTCSNV